MEEEKLERIRPSKKKAPIIIVAVIFVIGIFVLLSSMVLTSQNEYTLIRQFGKIERVISEPGLSLMIPFIQSADTLPKDIRLFDLEASDVITKDKKTMISDSYVLWQISDPLLFVQTLNSQMANAESRINAVVYNSIKNIISNMDQSDVISGRDGALSEAILNNIGTVLEKYGIHLVTFETKHLDLPSDNKAAVYQRMISERNNIAASYTASGESEAKMIRTATDNEITISISEAKAQAQIIGAEGEAEYMKILSDAYKDQSRSDFYAFVRALDAAKLTMTGDKTIILSSDSPLAQIFNSAQ